MDINWANVFDWTILLKCFIVARHYMCYWSNSN